MTKAEMIIDGIKEAEKDCRKCNDGDCYTCDTYRYLREADAELMALKES